MQSLFESSKFEDDLRKWDSALCYFHRVFTLCYRTVCYCTRRLLLDLYVKNTSSTRRTVAKMTWSITCGATCLMKSSVSRKVWRQCGVIGKLMRQILIVALFPSWQSCINFCVAFCISIFSVVTKIIVSLKRCIRTD